MKEMVVNLFEVIATGLVVFFCMQMLFQPREDTDIAEMARQVADQYQSRELLSANGERMENLLEAKPPQVKAVNRVFQTGEDISFPSLIQVKCEEEADFVPVGEAEDVLVELLDITDRSGKSLGNDIFAETDQMSDELTLPVSYSEETGRLCFYQSGCYTLKIRATGPYGRYKTIRVTVPVEAG